MPQLKTFVTVIDQGGFTAVLEIVGAGLGVSIVPSAGLARLPDGVVARPLVPETVRRLGIAVSASASAPARAFLEQIAALISTELHSAPAKWCRPE